MKNDKLDLKEAEEFNANVMEIHISWKVKFGQNFARKFNRPKLLDFNVGKGDKCPVCTRETGSIQYDILNW